MAFVDSHCHLDRLQLEGGVERALAVAAAAQVTHMLCVCIDIEHFPPVLELAERHPQVSASVGVHPHERHAHDPEADELVRLGRHRQVVAVGETGLDYVQAEGDMGWQQERLRRHIAAARALDKPLIVHMRAATADTLRILREEDARQVGGVLHCFVEDWDTARAAMDLGFYISFSGIVTFRNAQDLRDVARRMPANRMLIETDAPFLTPVPHRGKPNHPALVRLVADCLAQVRGEDPEQVGDYTSENYHALFGPRG